MTTLKKIASLTGATFLALMGTAGANLLIDPNGAGQDWFKTESGQGVTTGITGYVGPANLIAVDTGLYTFTFVGAGNASKLNEFFVGPSLAAAKASGDIFCNHAIAGVCGASTVGASFSVSMTSGEEVPFGYQYDQGNGTGGHQLLDSTKDALNGAYLLASDTSLSCQSASIPSASGLPPQGCNRTPPLTGPNPMAFIGLADSPYPADSDFQDMDVKVTEIPEPASFVLIGTALAGLAGIRRRRPSRGPR